MSRVLRAHLRPTPSRAPLGVSVISPTDTESDPTGSVDALRRALLDQGWRVDWLRVPPGARALRAAILAAREELVVCEGAGTFDARFHERALALLSRSQVALVIGSALLEGSTTQVSSVRRAVELMRSRLLGILIGFCGTDVHGSKAFRRAALLPVVEQCVLDGEAFTTELVVRAQRAGLDVREIPVSGAEPRSFSWRSVLRIPPALWDIARLTRVVRVRGRAP